MVPTVIKTFGVERDIVIANWRCSGSLVYGRKVTHGLAAATVGSNLRGGTPSI